MSKKQWVLSLLGVGLLGTALTAGMCTPPGGGDCTGDGNCTIDERCHPTLKTCVPNCVKQTDICEEGTTCSDADIGGVDFKNICVCSVTSDQCPSGEKCNPLDYVCDVPCTSDADCSVYPESQNRTCQDSGGTKFCLMAAGTCTAGSCPAGQYCDDSRFESTNTCINNPTTCDHETNCFDNDIAGLCDPVTSNETHNLCVAPDDVTNTCDAPGQMGDNGPILYIDDPATDIEEITDENDDPATCVADGHTLMMVTLMVEGTLNSAPYSNTYWLDGTSWAATTYYVDDFTDGTYTFLMIYMCFTATPSERAFYHNNGTAESNRVCVDF
ncbi:MAG: hypothetical protein JXR83_08045 [Deltaproteobacteria bacterium]|nr:hypothetical protein [Deltaproteobacteria bacterium]